MDRVNPYADLDKSILAEVYYSTETRDNMLALCDDYGSRFDGTDDALRAAEFVRGKFESYGIANARLESYDYRGWIRGPATLTVAHPINREIACISLPYCHPAEVSGDLV